MNKHTTGPWLSRWKSDSVHESSDTHPYGCQIFRFADGQGPSDDDLNLILSAPDLLEALEALADSAPSACCVDFHHKPGDYHDADESCPALDRYEAACLSARAAIARARGQ